MIVARNDQAVTDGWTLGILQKCDHTVWYNAPILFGLELSESHW